jgi:hypothetical protein
MWKIELISQVAARILQQFWERVTVTILFDTLTQTNIGVLLKCIALWKVRIPSLWHSSKRRERVYHTSLQWQRMYLHHVIMLGASPSNKNQTHRYVLYSLSTLQYGCCFFSSTSSSLLLILNSTNVLYMSFSGTGHNSGQQDIMSYYREQNVLYMSFSGTGHNVH